MPAMPWHLARCCTPAEAYERCFNLLAVTIGFECRLEYVTSERFADLWLAIRAAVDERVGPAKSIFNHRSARYAGSQSSLLRPRDLDFHLRASAGLRSNVH